MKKVYIVGGGYAFASMFRDFNWEVCDYIQDADLVQFTGGEDINPAIYGHDVHLTTFFNPVRDRQEIAIYNFCLANKKKLAGVCRGAQLFCALTGGTLWQDIDGHAINGAHDVIDVDTGEVWQTNSLHHQLMCPNKTAKLIAWSQECTYLEKRANNSLIRITKKKTMKEPEVVYWEDIDALGLQGHPEMSGRALQEKYFFYISKYLNVEG